MAARTTASSLSRSNLTILFVIAAISIALSIFTYQSFVQTASQIAENAQEDVRRTAAGQASNIRGILENKINTVVSNLHVIASAPSVQSGEELEPRVLFDTAETTIGPPLDFVAWLNSDGRLIWSSNVNASTWSQYEGVDLSSRPYFIEARETGEPYFSSVIESVDNIPRVFMSVPIVNSEGAFGGIVYAGYRLDTAAQLVSDEVIDEHSESRILLLSRDGVLLYSITTEFIGENLSSPEVQSQFIPSAIPASERQRVNEALASAVRGEAGSVDITISDVTNTVAFEPVVVNGKHFMTLFILTPHIFAEDTAFLISQQQSVSIITIGVIGAVAIGMAFLVLNWNKRLQLAVDARTAELKDANKQLVEANERLKASDKMQREFINIAAHELRTPVQPLLGIVEQLDDQIKEGGLKEITVSKPEVEMLARNANRLVRLTSDILDVSRIESNSLKLTKEKVDLHEKIVNVIEDTIMLTRDYDKVRIGFESTAARPLIVEADRIRLFQVLSNLIRNAVKSTKEGAITVRLEQTDEGYAKIEIKDTGEGIAPEMMPRLFTKFASGSASGMGLGLFITKSIVEAHGGRIWAENNDNDSGRDGGRVRGATFAFTLPIANAQEQQEYWRREPAEKRQRE